MQNNELDNLLANVPATIMPERDLWPQLAKKLPKRSIMFSKSWLSGGLAASLALFTLLWWHNSDHSPAVSLTQLEQQYQQQLTQKLAGIEHINEAYGDWQWQLAMWQQAITQVQQTLGFYPEDTNLQQQLLSLYQQQLDYISMLTDVAPAYY